MLRRLRSALVLGTIWAVVWLPFGIVVGLVSKWVGPPGQTWSDFASGLVVWTLLGGVSGGIFALLLGLFERRRTIHELSALRLALWGTIAGGLLPIAGAIVLVRLVSQVQFTSGTPVALASMAALGAACAVGTVAIARRGERPVREARP